jgi:sugar lactone lactonase YvrE
MVFKKTILQVFSGKEPFTFDDFVRGTLRLFNYAVDHNIDVKINISGSAFEPYMIVNNFKYDPVYLKPRTYYNGIDNEVLIQNLDAFLSSSDPIYTVTSNVRIDRNDIYNLSYIGYDALVRYKETLYAAAQARVLDNLLYRTHSDNLLYGYSIIYILRDELQYKMTKRTLASLANQIRQSLDMNKDMMVVSNSIQLRKILSEYIEMSSFAVKHIDDSDIDIGVEESIPNVEDAMIDFIILMKSKKIYRFADTIKMNSHSLKFSGNIPRSNLMNLYDTAFDINTLIGNLEITSIPLYYGTYTVAGYASSSPKTQPGLITDSSGTRSLLDNPSGIAIDSLGNVFFSDTSNHRICKLDGSGNLSTYAGSTTGVSGFVNGSNTDARFNSPTALAVDRSGNLYVADTGNNAIRIIELNKIYDSSGIVIETNRLINTLVGTGSVLASSAVGFTTMLNAPRGVAVDISGSIYISDTGNHRICKVTSGGTLQTLAGTVATSASVIYLSGNLDGKEASFKSPTGLCVDLLGNVFVADTGNNMIRRITPSGKVSTVAGNGQPFFKEGKRLQAGFCRPTGITVDLQNILYVTDSGNNVIRRITTDGNVLPVVGSPQQLAGSIDGFGALDHTKSLVPFERRATFNGPLSLAIDGNKIIYVADTLNNTIRKIVPTFSTPTKIKPIAMQALRISKSYGITYTLGPSLLEHLTPQNTMMVTGHKRGLP